jgi:hypothetical protein
MMHGNNAIILYKAVKSGDSINPPELLLGITEIYLRPIYISPTMHCTAITLLHACDSVLLILSTKLKININANDSFH